MGKAGCICAIYGCNNYRLQRNRKSFYRFPRNKDLCAQWVIKSQRSDLNTVLRSRGPEHLNKNYTVCSDHFQQKDFRNKNLLSQGLWPGTVPSLLLPNAENNTLRHSPVKRERDVSEAGSSNTVHMEVIPPVQQYVGPINKECKPQEEVAHLSAADIKEEPVLEYSDGEPEQETEQRLTEEEMVLNPTVQETDQIFIKEEPIEWESSENDIPDGDTSNPLRLNEDELLSNTQLTYNGSEAMRIIPRVKEENVVSRINVASNKADTVMRHEDDAQQENAYGNETRESSLQTLSDNVFSDNSLEKTSTSNSCVKAHVSECPYPCSVCHKSFAQHGTLKENTQLHTGERPYICSICQREFLNSSKLRKHTGDRPYSCSVCHMTFTLNRTLKEHMHRHTGEKPYSCGICHRTFSNGSTLRQHTRVHTGKRPYSCSTCNMAFTQNSSLKRHLLLHTGERPYSCSICRKTFMVSSNLKTHFLKHTGERPHTCGLCQRTFTQKSHLNRHLCTCSDLRNCTT